LAINSFYELVRKEARKQLFKLLSQFPFSSTIIINPIVKFLNKMNQSQNITEEQLEGCLLLLKGDQFQQSLLLKQNWSSIGKLWSALFKCKFFDKKIIKHLLDQIYFSTNENFNTFDNTVLLSENCVRLAYEILPQFDQEHNDRLESYKKLCDTDQRAIKALMNDLIDISRDSGVVWKNQEISLFSIIFLFNSCVKNKHLLTSDCVELFVESLVHENVNFREVVFYLHQLISLDSNNNLF